MDAEANAQERILAVDYDQLFAFRGVAYHVACLNETADFQALGQTPKPPVLLLHGFSQSVATWNGVALLLSNQRKMYGLDFVGHGRSDRPARHSAYDLEEQAALVLALAKSIERENGAKPLVIAYSMGGRIALGALSQDPTAFCGVILESVGLGCQSDAQVEEARRLNLQRAQRLRQFGVGAFMAEWEQAPVFASQKSLLPSERAALHAARVANDAEALALTFEHSGVHVMPQQDQMLEMLAQPPCPVVYCTGQLDQKYVALASILPPAVKVEVVADAGHNVHFEQLRPFVQLIERTGL